MFAPEGNTVKLVILYAFTSVLSNFLNNQLWASAKVEGYCSAYPNTADDGFENFLNRSFASRNADSQGLSKWGYTWFWSTFLNIWFIGFLVGTFSTIFIADQYGRKTAILLANGVNLFATILSVLAIFFCLPELLVAGRMIGAAGSGLSMNALILFVQETSPTALRGTCSFLSEGTFIAANVIGMGMGMDVVLGRHLIWLIGLAAFPCALGLLIVLPLEESPKYLLINKNNRKAALSALIYYQGKNANHTEILEEMLKESDTNRIDLPLFQAVGEVMRQAYLRKAIAIGILSLQIIVGIWPIIYNSTELLEAHMSAKMAQLSSFVFIMANFLASIVGMCAVERLGRRPMLLYCGVANTVCLSCYIIFDRLARRFGAFQFKVGCVSSLIGYGITYGIAVGPIAAFITSELVPQRFRSLVQSIVYGMNTIIIFVLSFITLPLYRLVGVWAFVPLFIIPSCVSLVYLFVRMPETRGREIHEIVEELMWSDDKIDSLPDVYPKALVEISGAGNLASALSGAKRLPAPIFPAFSALSGAGLLRSMLCCGGAGDSAKMNGDVGPPSTPAMKRSSASARDVPKIVVKSESNTTLVVTLDDLCHTKGKHGVRKSKRAKRVKD